MQEFDPTKNYNEIDLSCDVMEEDDSFGGPIKEIRADINKNGVLQVNKNFKAQEDQDFSGFNAIDMECSIGEDDDDFGSEYVTEKKSKKEDSILDFGDEENDYIFRSEEHIKPDALSDYDYDDFSDELRFKNKELVAEDMLEEKKKISQGEVEADYWKQLSKKHAKTNIKGAYNTHFHFAGDPKREAELFNHDMQSTLPHSHISLQTTSEADTITGVSSEVTSGGEAASAGDGGAGMGESIKSDKYAKYQKLYEDLLLITGFEVTPVKSDLYALKDTFNLVPEREYTKNELKVFLTPYMQDYFICPLSQKTGKDFKNCEDVCDWYTDEIEKQYPDCRNDIDYCDMFANHWEEIC